MTARPPGEVLPILREVERHAREGRWAVGIVAYEAAPAFDGAFKTLPPLEGIPLAAFAIFDAPSEPDEDTAKAVFRCSHWQSDMAPAIFREKVERIREGIAAGAYYQVNLTTRLRAKFEGEPRALFEFALRGAARRLRALSGFRRVADRFRLAGAVLCMEPRHG